MNFYTQKLVASRDDKEDPADGADCACRAMGPVEQRGLLVSLGLVLGESEAALQGRRKSGNEGGGNHVGGDVEEVDEHSVVVSETRGWNGSVAVMTSHSSLSLSKLYGVIHDIQNVYIHVYFAVCDDPIPHTPFNGHKALE